MPTRLTQRKSRSLRQTPQSVRDIRQDHVEKTYCLVVILIRRDPVQYNVTQDVVKWIHGD
ncbi:MAG: hypothetical protein OXG08_10705 [Gammaproteobacteria bacterium]|nr:hypothetical protein [Gammaproteobacteria bacterium]